MHIFFKVQNFILSEISQAQETQDQMFSLICEI
jgi:hypothetical protein